MPTYAWDFQSVTKQLLIPEEVKNNYFCAYLKDYLRWWRIFRFVFIPGFSQETNLFDEIGEFSIVYKAASFFHYWFKNDSIRHHLS